MAGRRGGGNEGNPVVDNNNRIDTAGHVACMERMDIMTDQPKMENQGLNKIPSDLSNKVCVVIMDTGFIGSADDYVKTYYGKPFSELTVNEAEMIVRTLGNKPGCLYEGDPKDLIPIQEEEHEDNTSS